MTPEGLWQGRKYACSNTFPASRSAPALSTIASRLEVFQWREDGITLPPGCVYLASSPASNVQAFRHGEHAYRLQFHLEVDQSLIDRFEIGPRRRRLPSR